MTTATRHEARPAYTVRPSDLVPIPSECCYCGGPTTRLHPDIPQSERGAHDQGAPLLDELGGLTRYLRPHPCSHCELRQILHDLFPAAPQTVVSPEQAELVALRAMLTPPPAPPAEEAVEGAKFKAGTLYATPAALDALARAHRPGYDPSVVGAHEFGRPHLRPYLERHLRGASAEGGNVAKGLRLGPLAESADRAAAAIDRKLGSVVSRYPLGSATTHRATLVIRSELGLQPLTLVALAEELPNR